MKRIIRQFILWKHKKYAARIDHADVLEHVRSEGRMTSRYSFMVLMSCGIAILGLLLSSPAVVIGAMLVSPLMGPIMSFGFSLCVLDLRQLKKALEAIIIGMAFSLLIAGAIAFVSPISDATPEIMARTQPNLFDLMVAVLSGMAGGYATIKRKGETIVGVAIATALMPPLAVVGYGIATQQYPIAHGALLLFMTNLLAISLSVTMMAKWYGFGRKHSPKHTLWQTCLILGVFAALSLPLGVALKNIAYQSYVTKTARSHILKTFEGTPSRISSFNVSFRENEPIQIDAVMLTKAYQKQAEMRAKKDIQDSIGINSVALTLDQIVIRDESIIETSAAAALPETALVAPMQSQRLAQQNLRDTINNLLFFPTQFVHIDHDEGSITVVASQAPDITLGVLRRFEKELSLKYPGYLLVIIPPYQSLPPLYFATGDAQLSEAAQASFDNILWALQRWNMNQVDVLGFASSLGEYNKFNNNSLAYKRAAHVSGLLFDHGISATKKAEYDSSLQKKNERDFGQLSFHRVEIRPTAAYEPLLGAQE